MLVLRFAPVAADSGMGWDEKEGGLIIRNWRLLCFRIEWWSLPFPHLTGKQSKTFRDENLREAKPKLQCNRKKVLCLLRYWCHSQMLALSSCNCSEME